MIKKDDLFFLDDDDEIFKTLSEEEKNKKLEDVSDGKHDIQLWEMGSSVSEIFHAYGYNKEKSLLVLKANEKDSQLIKHEAMLNFETSQIQYFSSGFLDISSSDHREAEDNDYSFVINDEIFKCEKRKDIRLPFHDRSDVLLLVKGTLFKVNDLSVSGIGIQVDEGSVDFIGNVENLQEMVFRIDQEDYKLPNCEIVHISKFIDPKTQMKKVGMKFKSPLEQSNPSLRHRFYSELYSKFHSK